MRASASLARGLLIVAILGVMLPTQAVAQTPLPLDHFKCYFPTQLEPGPLGDVPVALMDQFDRGIWDTSILVRRPVRFCTPVEKTRIINGVTRVTPIKAPDHHLLFYRIATHTLEPTRRLLVSNQFGSQRTIYVFQAVALAVPAQKQGHDRPVGLDHYKCYGAYGWAPNQPVTLKDQFKPNGISTTVLQAFLFCNPVAKIHGTRQFPIQRPLDHLLCYYTRPTWFTVKPRRWVIDQFAERLLEFGRSDMLCVPTKKHSFSSINP